jgi:hypothetical protein
MRDDDGRMKIQFFAGTAISLVVVVRFSVPVYVVMVM